MDKKRLISQSKKKEINNQLKNFCKFNKSNYKLIILTTAITRPKLHLISFNNYKNFIPNNISIKWIINIDYIKFDEDNDLEFTKSNILDIFKDFKNIDFEFILNEIGNFNKAVRNITSRVFNSLSNNTNRIFYLEDDWFCIDKDFNINKIHNYDIYKLHNDGDIRLKTSFQPCLLTPIVWYLMFYQKLNKNKDLNHDPEKICQMFEYELKMYDLKYKKDNKFKDIGRDNNFKNENMIRGWFQRKDHGVINISQGYIKIDKLINSFIYFISNNYKNLNKDNLNNNFKLILENYYLKYFIDKIYDKFIENYDNKYLLYQKFSKINLKYDNIKDIYENIDNIQQIVNSNETGA